MSELATKLHESNAKWRLLTGVSVYALIAVVSQVRAATNDRPTIWVEAGVQLDRLTNGQEPFAPPFVSSLLQNPFTPPQQVQKPPLYAFGQEGSVSIQPEGSEWKFTTSLRYGRANSSGNIHEQSAPPSLELIASIPIFNIHFTNHAPASTERFATTASRTHSAYTVLDFEVGKDVGLGAFGTHSSSVFNAGVRFAQFTASATSRIDSDPDFSPSYKYLTSFGGQPAYVKFPQEKRDLFSAKIDRSLSFHGIGPSVSWEADAALLGNLDAGTITLDWGMNGAVLFGRQKMAAQHSTMAHHGSIRISHGPLPTLYPTAVHDTVRSRSIVVPNIGGLAGFSLRFPNAKVSFGYRADFFFGAIDGGIDTRKTYDRNFYGPFATISIGLGG